MQDAKEPYFEILTAVVVEPLIAASTATLSVNEAEVTKTDNAAAFIDGTEQNNVFEALHPVKRRTKEHVKYKRLTLQQKTNRD